MRESAYSIAIQIADSPKRWRVAFLTAGAFADRLRSWWRAHVQRVSEPASKDRCQTNGASVGTDSLGAAIDDVATVCPSRANQRDPRASSNRKGFRRSPANHLVS